MLMFDLGMGLVKWSRPWLILILEKLDHRRFENRRKIADLFSGISKFRIQYHRLKLNSLFNKRKSDSA
jgi:hypothetical protein